MITLYDLMHNTSVQGDVTIRVYNDHDYDPVAVKDFPNVDDLLGEDIPDEWEELEVRYMFCAAGMLIIEIYMEEDE